MRQKMTKDLVPTDFTLGLVAVDAIPVIFFGCSMVLAGILLRSPVFLLGAGLCLFAGLAKVLWKLIVVLRQKNIWWLFLQMRIVMPIGLVLMVVGCVMTTALPTAFAGALRWPAAPFFGAGVLGMVLMLVFGFTLDSSSLRANWIEQITNGFAQLCFFVGLLLLL